jgi:hypothetical protein
VLVVLGASREEREEIFEEVEEMGRVRCGFCMPFENGRSVMSADGPSCLWNGFGRG